MLTFRQLDDVPNNVVKLFADTEQAIVNDMARRIVSMGEVSAATNWQMLRLEMLGTEQEVIVKELGKTLNLTQKQLYQLFDEAATRTLASDDKIYKAAGYNPIPLKDNPYLQNIIHVGLARTTQEFINLTRTTAQTATMQFERALDKAYMQIISGAFDYRTAVKGAIRDLTVKGLASITYPGGHTDYLDVAARRAIMTGVNQTAGELQLARAKEMDTDLVETTAHHGARPDHMIWQGRWFSLTGETDKYDDFYEATGYGTGAGLCGWNCRHSFFPVIEGLDEKAYDADRLRDLNNREVTFNGKKMNLYDATQHQRYLERQIRRWKREGSAYDAAGLDNTFAKGKIREWQARQRDFISQTGLSRDYFRERAGIQNLESVSKDDIIRLSSSNRFRTGSPDAPKVAKAEDSFTSYTLADPDTRAIIPQGATLTNVNVIAGQGTSTPIKSIPRLDSTYGGDPTQWSKRVGTAKGAINSHEVHWYENNGKSYEARVISKTRGK